MHDTYLLTQKPVLHQGWSKTNALYHQFDPINLLGAQETFVHRAVEPRIWTNYYYYNIIYPNNNTQPE